MSANIIPYFYHFSGWFAGPVAFGRLVDTACVIWSASCFGTGACALYDNDDFRIKKCTFELLPKIISILLHVIVFFKARKKNDWSVDKPVTAGEADEEKDVAKSMIADQESEMTSFKGDWKTEPIFKGHKR